MFIDKDSIIVFKYNLVKRYRNPCLLGKGCRGETALSVIEIKLKLRITSQCHELKPLISGPQKTATANPTFVTSHCNNTKIRSKSVQLTGKLRSRSGSIIIPVTPHQVPHTTSPSSTTSHAKSSINVTRPCGTMKQDSCKYSCTFQIQLNFTFI